MNIDKKQLIEALEVMSAVCPKKDKTMPALCNTHFEEKAGKLVLTGADIKTWALSKIDVIDFHGRPAAFTTNTAALLKVLKTYPQGDINIVSVDGVVSFISGSCTYNAPVIPATEFPSAPVSLWENSRTNDHKFWLSIIGKMLPFISREESRVNLNGMFAQKTDSGSTLVATDGHRLATLNTLDIGLSPEKDCIIPLDGLLKAQKIIKRLKGAVRSGICADNLYYKIETNNTVIYMRLIDEKFPNYKQVIPLENDIIITVNTEELIDAMKRLVALSTEKYTGSSFKYDGQGGLKISDHQAQMKSTFTQELKVNVSGGGAPLTIGLNAKYILGYLNVIQSDTVTIKLKNENTQAILSSDDYLMAVIMPMKLK